MCLLMFRKKIRNVFLFGISTNLILVFQSIILARYLGPEMRGELAIPIAFITLFLPIVTFGMKQNLAYLEGHKQNIPNLNTYIWLSIFFLLMVVLFFSLYLFLYNNLENISHMSVLLLFFFKGGSDLATFRLLSLRMAEKISEITFYKSLLEMTLLILMLILKLGTVTNILFLMGTVSIGMFFLIILVSAKYSKKESVNTKTIKLNVNFFKKSFGFAIPLFLINVIISFDILMLEALSTQSSIGIYQVAVSVANIIWIVPAVISSLIFSESMYENLSLMLGHLTNLYKYMFFFLPLLIVPFFLSEWIFTLLFGENFSNSAKVFNILLVGYYLMLVYKFSNGVFASHGLIFVPSVIFLVSAAVNFYLNFSLIPLLNEIGAAIATMISYSLCAILFFSYTFYVKKNV